MSADASHGPERIRGLGKVHHVARDRRARSRHRSGSGATCWGSSRVGLDIEDDRVRIAFLPVGESKVELVQPTDDTTGVARFLAARARASITSASRSRTSPRRCSRLEIDGIELIDTAPRRGAEGPVAFLHPRSCHGVLVELIEAPGGPAWGALGY